MQIDYMSDYPMPWKIDSPVERLLGKLADRSERMKSAYIRYYKRHDAEFHQVAIQKIEKILSESVYSRGGDIDQAVVARDMLYSFHRFGLAYFEYVMIRADLLNKKGREEYLTDRMRFSYYKLLNPEDTHHFFDNKDETYERFKKYYKRDFCAVRSRQDEAFFLDICSKHDKLCLKPLNSCGGKGVISCNSDDMIKAGVDFYLEQYPKGFAVEELIEQALEVASFHEKSLNTMRVCTIRMENRIELFNTYFRIGVGDNFACNGACGSILAAVDLETGVIVDAKNEDGKQFLFHPDSGKQIVGYHIPKWDAAKVLAQELAQVIPEHRLVGWDLALTEDGWVMMEGNSHSQLVAQSVIRKGIRSYMDGILRELNLN